METPVSTVDKIAIIAVDATIDATASLFPGLYNEVPDADGLYDGMVLPKPQSNLLWRISWLYILSAAFAIYKKHYDLAIIPLGVWLTSINYWRRPDYSWRRYMDIGWVLFGVIYQSVRAYNSEYAIVYYTTLFTAIVFLPMGIYFHRIGDMWMSALCHSQIHLFGNMGNILLYSSDMQDISDMCLVP